MTTEESFYREAFLRNLGLLTREEQEKLKRSTVAIAGLGGVGGIFTLGFARLGVGGFHLADPDEFEIKNMNRQAGAMVSTQGKPKAEVMRSMVLDINPHARVQTFTGKEDSLDGFLQGVDIVVDALDFFIIDERRKLYRAARERGLYVVSAGPIGFGSALQVFDPKGMSFDEYFDLNDTLSHEEMNIRFGLGIAPKLLQRAYFHVTKVNFSVQVAPSLVTGTFLAANLVTTAAIKILLQRGKLKPMPHSVHVDPYVGKHKKVYLPFGNRGPIQRLKLWYVRRLNEQNKAEYARTQVRSEPHQAAAQ